MTFGTGQLTMPDILKLKSGFGLQVGVGGLSTIGSASPFPVTVAHSYHSQQVLAVLEGRRITQ